MDSLNVAELEVLVSSMQETILRQIAAGLHGAADESAKLRDKLKLEMMRLCTA